MQILAAVVEKVSIHFKRFKYLYDNNFNMFSFICLLYNLNIEASYTSFKNYIGQMWPYMMIINDIKAQTPFVKNKPCKMFSSYSYVGSHMCRQVQSDAIQGALAYSSGNHGSRMLLGNSNYNIRLERKLANWFQKEACLLSSCGYMACSSVFPVLCKNKTIIFADSHVHASIVSGFKLTNAKVVYFKHNNTESLSHYLNWYRFRRCQKVVVVESLYSMDGTICNLPSLRSLCDTHKAILVVDEAHGLGTLGPHGKGIESHYNMNNAADVLIGTFSKSLSNLGGYICGTRQFIQNCEYYCHSNIFTAGLSAYHSCGALSALLNLHPHKVKQLQQNTKLLRQRLTAAGFHIEGSIHSPVIPVVFEYDVLKVIHIAHTMHNEGFAIAPVLPPACSIKYPRFRITATSWQTREEIIDFVNTFKRINDNYVSAINTEMLAYVKVLYAVKCIPYKLNDCILAIWTCLLSIQPRVNALLMKYMFALRQCYHWFIIYKIIQTYCTIRVQ